MYLDSEKKKEIFEKYGKSNTDTGSPEAQIALFSYRIAHLTEHLKSNHKDHSTERALKMLVGKRRRGDIGSIENQGGLSFYLSHTANATQGKSAQCILIPKLKRHFQSSPPCVSIRKYRGSARRTRGLKRQ